MRFLLYLIFGPLLAAQIPDLATPSNRLQALLQQLKPKDWPESAIYVPLLKAALNGNAAIPVSAQSLNAHPDQILDALHLLEQLHAVQESVSVLAVGVSRYQNPALAELLIGLLAEGKPARDAFSQRVFQLVADREEQFQVADHEAQRCRAILSKGPHPPARAVKSKE